MRPHPVIALAGNIGTLRDEIAGLDVVAYRLGERLVIAIAGLNGSTTTKTFEGRWRAATEP